MKRLLLSILSAAAVLPLTAVTAAPAAPGPQSPANPAAAVTPAPKIVASLNGEVITQDTLDRLYDGLGTHARDDYDKAGGKQAFLENYLRKRLLVQEAIKGGFDRRPEVKANIEAAKESVLFERYVRDVISSQVVTEAMMKKYYDAHPDEFNAPEMVKVSHIIVIPDGAGPRPKSDEKARELIQRIAAELRVQNALPPSTDEATAHRLVQEHFAAAARKYSEDSSGQKGGDLGWNPRGVFDKDFEEAAFNMRPHMVSGVIKSKFGYHLLYIEDKKPAGIEPLDEARIKLREYLQAQHKTEILEAVTRLTNELRTSSNIRVYPENIH